jgi:hypothetical protein
MKKLVIVILLLLPIVAYAEKPAVTGDEYMSEQNMQMMAKNMQEMQKCLESIKKGELAEIEKQSVQFEKKVRSLCSKGKRDQAQKEALSFGKKMSKHPAMQSMNKCTEKLQGVMQNMPMPGQDMDFTNRHACDELSGTD